MAANARLLEEKKKLEKAHKALEETHSLLVKLMSSYKLNFLNLTHLVPLLPLVIMQILLGKMLG